MRDDEGGGHDLEAEHALGCRFLDSCAPASAPTPWFIEIVGDALQHFGQIGSRTAAWIQARRRYPPRGRPRCRGRLSAPCPRGRPCSARFRSACTMTPNCFAQRGVESFEEGFVEIGNRLALGEAGEKGFSIHAIQRGGRSSSALLRDRRVAGDWEPRPPETSAASTGARRCQTASRQLKGVALV